MSAIQRFTPAERSNIQLKTRAKGDEQVPEAFVGYAAVFYREGEAGTEYRLWSDYLERILPGAFDRAVSDSHDARGLFNHNSERLLGRVSSGTCTLSVDSVGLRFEIPYDANDPDHQSVACKIQRGDLTGCSFAFSNATATWEEIDNDGDTIWIRNITDLDLHDVGPVTYPAYEATEVGTRDDSPTRFRTSVESESELVEARSVLDAHRNALKSAQDNEQFEVDNRWLKIQSERY